MKVLASLKTAKSRHPDCQIVKRRGRVYVICKSNPRFKARQGRVEPQDPRSARSPAAHPCPALARQDPEPPLLLP